MLTNKPLSAFLTQKPPLDSRLETEEPTIEDSEGMMTERKEF